MKHIALSVFVVGAACSPQNLYVAHDTNVGLSARLSADRQQGQLVLGYDRDFVTIVPTTVDRGNGKQDAMALISCTELEVTGPYLSKYTDVTVSGDAATTFGEALNNSGDVFDCSSIGIADGGEQ